MNPLILRRLIGGRSEFAPNAAFFAGTPGFSYDFKDKSKLFQNSNGTTAVMSDNDPIGYVTDLSGNGNHGIQATAGNRPLYKSSVPRASFNGSSHCLASPAIDLSGTDKLTVIICLRTENATNRIVMESSPDFNGNNGSFAVTSEVDGALSACARGSAVGTCKTPARVIPNDSVFTSIYNISGAALTDEIRIRLDSVDVSGTYAHGPLGAGNFGNYPVNIGARNGSGYPFDGSIYRIVVIGRQLTSKEISDVENWCGNPAGLFF